jgi:hypothetical protein
MFLKRTEIVGIYSQNGEVHLVLQENKMDKCIKKRKSLSFVKMKAFMKKEAAKPLLLVRE